MLVGGERVPQRVALAVFGPPQRREFPGEQTVRFLLLRYLKYTEHLWKPVLCCSGGIQFMQSNPPTLMWLLNSCCFLWRIFLSFMLDRRPCTTTLLNSHISAKVPLHLLCLLPAEQNRIQPEQKLLCGKSSSICKSRAKRHSDGCRF
jgi:hypothetical protein